MTARQLTARLGRRGAFLLAVGIAWVITGTGVVERGSRFGHYTSSVADILGSPWWGVAWMVGGVVGVGCAFRRGAGEDTAGFIALQLPPLAWFLIATGSWVVSWFTDYGNANGWMFAAQQAAVIAAIYVVSGWPETPEGATGG